jgi:nucleoside-diphosphate-sugar epimerase
MSPMNSADELPFARALVTGANGFIGRALVRRLVSAGVSVACAGRRGAQYAVDASSWSIGDLADPAFAEHVVVDARSPVVFHLAGAVTGSRALEAVLPTFGDTLSSSVNVLLAATRAGCERVVLMGSAEEPVGDEAPSSPYAAAKWAARAYSWLFNFVYATPVVIARPFMVYGPDQPDVSKLIPYTITSLLAGVPPALSSGRRRCDWVYIDDVIDGLLAVTSASDCVGREVDLGTGTLTTNRGVVDTICDVLGSGLAPRWGALPDREHETELLADVAETRRLCGWSASTDLGSGLRQTVDWYRRQAAPP